MSSQCNLLPAVDDAAHSVQGVHVFWEGVQLRDADKVIMSGIHLLLERGSGTRGLSTCAQTVWCDAGRAPNETTH